MNGKKIILDGNSLRVEDIDSLVKNVKVLVEVADASMVNVNKAKQFLDREAGRKVIYGVNTGFGPMASHIINSKQSFTLQENLIRSHAVGMGDPIREEYVLAAMVVRLNTLLKGFSGVSPELIFHLQTFINKRIIPIIPEHGAVGTSGDLVQLAHIALALMGEGEVIYEDKRQGAKEVLQKLQIEPYKLQAKEGLSLINGTSVMAGIASLLCKDAERLLAIATRTGALALELVHGFDDSISKRLHQLRPHPGQLNVANKMRNLLRSSHLLRNRETFQRTVKLPERVRKIPEIVQEVYSFRCIPQILGPILDILTKVQGEVTTEINSVTDNPIADWENNVFLHGGNFHGDYVAAGVDQLKSGLIKLTLLSERRTNFFLNQKVNTYLPPFLNLKRPGLTLALQGLQFVATSTTAHSQSLAFPHHVHSISTNGDNQDVVSMGTDAALIASKVVENAYIVLAIELITLAQAVDVLEIRENLSDSSKTLFDALRNFFPAIEEDRVLVSELAQVADLLKTLKNCNIAWDAKQSK